MVIHSNRHCQLAGRPERRVAEEIACPPAMSAAEEMAGQPERKVAEEVAGRPKVVAAASGVTFCGGRRP